MAERVTQEYIEALITSRDPLERVTQEYIEVLVGDRVRKARITQEYIEVLVVGFTPITGRVQGPAAQ